MAKGQARKCTKPVKQLATIDQLLAAGMKQGPAKKKDAIKKILHLVPGWTREQCWRRIQHLRRVTRFQDPAERHPNERKSSGEADPVRRPPAALQWTPADDDRLLNFAGYEPVKKIAQRLGRSERAVRFRLGALGMSAKVSDGWSLRALQRILRVRRTKLRQLIGSGTLRVRDPRVSPSSLAMLYDKIRASLDPSTIERIAAALAKGDDAYSWERAANLFGVPVSQIQLWISAGQLRVVDTFVNDRSFEDFCKNHGDKINMALMDPATKKWLVSEYGVPSSHGNIQNVPRARKARAGDKSLQLWKADSRQRLLPARQNLSASGRCGSRRSLQNTTAQRWHSHEQSVVQVDVRIGRSAPVLKTGVRAWQFRTPDLVTVVGVFHGANRPEMASHLEENGIETAFGFRVFERDPRKLAALRDRRMQAPEEEIIHSLQGNWKEDVLFELQQAVEAHDFYQKQMASCDTQLKSFMAALPTREALATTPAASQPAAAADGRKKRRPRKPKGNQPAFDLAEELERILGVNATPIDGIDVMTIQTVLAEVGPDLRAWKSEEQWSSWLNLAPKRDISGGRVIRHRREYRTNRAGNAFRMAAESLVRSQSYLGARYRYLRAKLGGLKAVKAMARVLACLYYRLVTKGQLWVDPRHSRI